MGAGAVGKSLIGRLAARGIALGPVSAVSYRVASRIANGLNGGTAVREASELSAAAVVLFHAQPEQMPATVELLAEAKISWPGRTLLFCDCEVTPAMIHQFRQEGASVAVAREFGLSGRVLLEGSGRGLLQAHRVAKEAQLKAVEILPGASERFDAAVTLSTCGITPLIDKATALLRSAGVRELDAPRLAAALIAQTADAYAHSGKQSWGWYARVPEVPRILAEADAARADAPEMPEMFPFLLLFGLELFDKHPELAIALRRRMAAPAPSGK